METLLTCKDGYEKVLSRELAPYKAIVQAKGRGWILAQSDQPLQDLCFAHASLETPTKVRATSPSALIEALLEAFMQQLADQRLTDSWPCHFFSASDEKLIRRTQTIKERWMEKLRKKMSRVAKLAVDGIPYGKDTPEGFFVFLSDFDQAFVSFNASSNGQQRMHMDPQAPSRSYLKLEEAFHIIGRAPKKNEVVIDLGASPGGWSHSALKHGAVVLAIDNGPLKEPVKSHPNLDHLQVDALTHLHDHAEAADWLLCDVLEKPEVILEVLKKWLGKKWCRRFIVNFKMQRTDPIDLLRKLRDPKSGLPPYCRQLQIRQLYHDREEITVMGETLPRSNPH